MKAEENQPTAAQQALTRYRAELLRLTAQHRGLEAKMSSLRAIIAALEDVASVEQETAKKSAS